MLLFVRGTGFCQINIFDTSSVHTDSLKASSLKTDSLKIDSTKADSLKAKRDSTKSSGGVDTLVTYTCTDSVLYNFNTHMMSLYKNATVDYQTMELKSEHIFVDWNTNVVSAEGVPDSADTLHGGNRGTPVMKDGGEKYDGVRLAYDFQTKKGKIDVGDTKSGEGYYHGEDIKKVDKNVLFVSNGRFTTCDDPDPHYYFASPRMKVTTQDQIIAEPMYLYISDVPIFALPFAVFPNKSGRRSGIIAPAYGEDGTRGRFLHHLGYYWAINDYMDLKTQSDLYTKGSWGLASMFQYNLMYHFNGGISGEYKKFLTGEPSDPTHNTSESYTVSIGHHQDIDPSMHADVNFTFASNNAYQNTIDLAQANNQEISSNATISKSWDSPNSMSLNLARTQNLVTGNLDQTLPSLSFTHSTSYPFRSKKSSDESSNLKWYEMIGVGYSMNASNTLTKDITAVNGVKVNDGTRDTTGTINVFQRGNAQNITQNSSISIAPKLGYISITPQLSFSDNHNWSYTKVPGVNQVDSSLAINTQRTASRSGTLSSGVGLSTKLFGLLQPNALGIQAIRHTFSPSFTVTYIRELYGDHPDNKNVVGDLTIGNLFEMKTIPAEPGKEGTKISLLNLTLGTQYIFTADSVRLQPLHMTFSSGVGSILNFNGGAVFDFYQLGPGGDVNKFLLSEEGRLARLTSFNLSFGTSLSGDKKKSGNQIEPTDTTQRAKSFSPYNPYSGMPEPDFSIPWQLNLNWTYGETKNPGVSRSSNISAKLDFNLTDKWKFGVQTAYDVVGKELLQPQITISRDLHCWLMDFNWVPIGPSQSYQFELRVKASELQDLKVTKSGSGRGIY